MNATIETLKSVCLQGPPQIHERWLCPHCYRGVHQHWICVRGHWVATHHCERCGDVVPTMEESA